MYITNVTLTGNRLKQTLAVTQMRENIFIDKICNRYKDCVKKIIDGHLTIVRSFFLSRY